MRLTQFLTEMYGSEKSKLDGFELEQYEEREEDNSKIFHHITDPKGKEHFVDHSPYEMIDKNTFANYITFFNKNGRFPGRKDINSNGPLRSEDVKKLAS